MYKEFWEELLAQVESHGPESVVFIMQTDSGDGVVEVTDVMYSDDRIVVCVS